MTTQPVRVFLLLGLAMPLGCTAVPAGHADREVKMTEDVDAVGRTLDALHAAASEADEEGYFGHFTDDGVFLGIDVSECWTIAEFREYAHPHFAAGKGWTYTSLGRFVRVSGDGSMAWFDERLQNAKLGECRGSGVLRRGRDGRWRVVQYNLTIPIPNALATTVAEQIRALESAGD